MSTMQRRSFDPAVLRVGLRKFLSLSVLTRELVVIGLLPKLCEEGKVCIRISLEDINSEQFPQHVGN